MASNELTCVNKKGAAIDSRLKRISERDRRRSITQKQMKRENKYWAKEDNILHTHIPYDGTSTKSPHILVNKWFHWLKSNFIVLKSPWENGDKKSEDIL